MKKNIRNLLCLLLALAMALSLAACGGGGESEKTEKPKAEGGDVSHPEFVYTSKFSPMDTEDESISYIRFLSTTDEGVYCAVERFVGEIIPEGAVKEWEGQFDVYETVLGIMSFDGKLSLVPGYTPLARPEEDNIDSVYGGLSGISVGEDGVLTTLEYQGISRYIGPEGVERGTEEYYANMSYEDNYFIRRLNADGSELSCTPVELPQDTYIDSRSFIIDKDGNALVSMSEYIGAIGPEGSVVYTIEPPAGAYLDKLIAMPGGRVMALTYGDTGTQVYELDLASRSFGEPADTPMDMYDPMPGAAGYDLCYNSGVNLYGINLGSEPEKIFSWLDADINSDNLGGFAITEDGNVAGYLNNWDHETGENSYEFFTMEKKPYDSVPHKTELSLGVMWLDWDIKDTIIKFNRKSPDFRVVVKDYSEYNTEDDYEAGMTKLLTEIMSGEMPDMLSINGLPYEQLAAKGLIQDIYPLIEADSELKNASFVESFFKTLEVDGKLCQIVPRFGISSATGSERAVGSEPGWSYEEFNQALAAMPEGCSAFPPYITRDEMLRTCLLMDMDLYADWATGECSFDSPEFAQLLEFTAQFPESYDWDANMEMPNEQELIASGMQMLTSGYIYSFEDMMYNDAYFGGSAIYKGFPSASGTGSAFNSMSGYAISTDCSDTQGAWSFLRTLLTEDYQAQGYGLPTNKAAFDKALKKAMTPEYMKDEEGNFVLDDEGNKIPLSTTSMTDGSGNIIELSAVTQEQADKLIELINSTTKLNGSDNKITEIVTEEAQAFYSGQKSAQEVGKLIQSKVSIYINEQR